MAAEAETFRRIKRATVALAVMHRPKGTQRAPFTILGSGFCVATSGIIVTCRHVQAAFMSRTFEAMLAELPPSEKVKELQPSGRSARLRPAAPQLLGNTERTAATNPTNSTSSATPDTVQELHPVSSYAQPHPRSSATRGGDRPNSRAAREPRKSSSPTPELLANETRRVAPNELTSPLTTPAAWP